MTSFLPSILHVKNYQVLSIPSPFPAPYFCLGVDSSFIEIALYLVSQSLRFPISNSVFKLAKEIFLKPDQITGISGWMVHTTPTGPCILTPATTTWTLGTLWKEREAWRHLRTSLNLWEAPGRTSWLGMWRKYEPEADGDAKPHHTDVTSALSSLPLIASDPQCLPGTTRLWCRELWGHLGFSLQLMPRIRNEKLCPPKFIFRPWIVTVFGEKVFKNIMKLKWGH